jgi:hypothetical protein
MRDSSPWPELGDGPWPRPTIRGAERAGDHQLEDDEDDPLAVPEHVQLMGDGVHITPETRKAVARMAARARNQGGGQ